MDKEAAAIIAAAMNNMAASSALQAETNVVLASKLEDLTNTVRGAQMRIDRHVKPLIERSKAQAAEVLAKLEVPNANPGA
jgi:hypothetical protein